MSASSPGICCPQPKGIAHNTLLLGRNRRALMENPFAFPWDERVVGRVKADTLCPKCQKQIPLEDVNVGTDIALCRRCGERWEYSELLDEQDSPPVDPHAAPPGAWMTNSPWGFEVGATTRSAIAFFLVPFMCVWSGGSLGGIYGTQLAKGEFDVVLSLFGIPFLLGTLLFGSIALMSVCGKVTVKVVGDEGTIFTGVGPIGRRRRFKWSQVTSIRRTESWGGRRRATASQQITITAAEKELHLAGGLKQQRLDFMLSALRQMWRTTARR